MSHKNNCCNIIKTPESIILYGFFVSSDKFNRIKIMFLDNYDSYDNTCEINKIKSLSEIKNSISFTKSYISKKSIPENGKSPLSDCKTCFNVKYTKKNIGYINDEPVPLLDLKQHKVKLLVKINYYNFIKNNTNFQGWNIKLLEMCLFDM
jgi:hypothetical protein